MTTALPRNQNKTSTPSPNFGGWKWGNLWKWVQSYKFWLRHLRSLADWTKEANVLILVDLHQNSFHCVMRKSCHSQAIAIIFWIRQIPCPHVLGQTQRIYLFFPPKCCRISLSWGQNDAKPRYYCIDCIYLYLTFTTTLHIALWAVQTTRLRQVVNLATVGETSKNPPHPTLRCTVMHGDARCTSVRRYSVNPWTIKRLKT